MSFQPVIPIGGYAGWRFLQRTMETQQQAFVESAPLTRATEGFRDRIASIQTAEDLVNDRELLAVALGAFGLDDDINSKAFIQRILEDGTDKDGALSSRLADKRYAALSNAFGFDGLVPRTQLSYFADEILGRFETKQFQAAVGEQNNDMRLALNVTSEINDIVASDTSDEISWFAVMGSPPLRKVFEAALGFPSSFGRIDIDQQRDAFQERAMATFGTDKVSDFLLPENQEKLIRLFIVRSQATAFAALSGGSVALTLLQSASFNYNRV